MTEFDADSIDPSQCRDAPRQIILKKKRFPTQIIAVIVGATRVNFSKEQDPKKRKEIVINVRFLFDLTQQSMVRRTINENGEDEEIDRFPLSFTQAFSRHF